MAQEKHAPEIAPARKLTDCLQLGLQHVCKRRENLPLGMICDCVFLAKEPKKWHRRDMCFHATISGAILPIWSKTAYDEVMLHCARIGFKP